MPAYRFIDHKREIEITEPRLPAPWINYLSNGRMHAFVSQAGGGFAWWRDPIHYRLTRYRMYNLPIDSPGFYVYIREKDGTFWSPTFRPCDTPLDAWSATHRPGSTTFVANKNGLTAKLTLFVAQDTDTLIWDLSLINKSGKSVEADVFAYVELSQLVWMKEVFDGYYWRHMLKTWWDAKNEAVLYLNHFQYHSNLDEVPLVYFASTGYTASYSGNRDKFMGAYRDEKYPVSLERNDCGNDELPTGEPCAALQHKVVLGLGEIKRIAFFLGAIEGGLLHFPEVMETLSKDLAMLRAPGTVDAQYEKLQAWWADHLSIFDCQIPDSDAMRQINTWSPLNSVQTARYSRAVNPLAPGMRGWGFRDSCQDMLAMAYRKPAWAKDMLLFLLKNQYKDGHTLHQMPFQQGGIPEDSPHSDNHLWLPMLVYAILSETGELSLLQESVPFLQDGSGSDTPASVWEHLKAGVNFTETHLGAHALPLTLHGDWNDIIGKFSRRGFGESVFAGQQYAYVLRLLHEMANAIGDNSAAAWVNDCLTRQEKALLACAWNGNWWLRGFDDDGVPVGSWDSHFGKLFLNTQSWSVLSGMGSREQLLTAMDSVKEHLDTDMGIKKLMPGFVTWPEVSDPFTGYGPGCGENGAIFCHANTWVIIAEAMLGRGDRAWQCYRRLVPHVALQKAGLETYQSEPYAWVSNIVGPENKRFGWANVTQVTGTAAWMDVAATQYLLGVRPVLKGLSIDPCIPQDWKSFTVDRKYRGCMLHIVVCNPFESQKGVRQITVDGKALDQSDLPVIPADLLQGKTVAEIVVTM